MVSVLGQRKKLFTVMMTTVVIALDFWHHLHHILQLGTQAKKYLLTVDINSIPIEMEVDSGAECSTVPLSLFEQS